MQLILLRILHIVFLQLLLATSVFAASQGEYHFRTCSPKGGFYYDGVQGIVQDGDGFIWILLENDLQRFDGYEYKRYSQHFQDSGILNFWHILKDTSGTLYVSTSKGLFRYVKLTDSFEKLFNKPAFAMTIDSENTLWCAFDDGLYRFKLEDTPQECLYKQKSKRYIKYFSQGKSGMYLAASFNKIFYSNNKAPTTLTLFYQLPDGYNIADISLVEEHLWILTQKHGVLKIDVHTKTINQWQLGDAKTPKNTLYIDKNNNVWVGTQQGLYILNPQTGDIQKHLRSNSRFDTFSLPNNSVWTIKGDSRQNIWIGTYAGGLCYVNIDEELYFKTYTPYESAISHNLVSSFAEDGELLWIGTAGGGLNCLNRKTETFAHYKSNGANSLSYNSINSLTVDSQQRLWIAMYRGGLDCFDIRTKRFRHFRNNPVDRKSLYSNDIRKILLTGDSNLWIAYQIDKAMISLFSLKTETSTHYPLGNDNYVLDILKDRYENLWILTEKTLYHMDTKKSVIKDFAKMGTLKSQSLGIDTKGNLWIGTIGQGLVKCDISTRELVTYADILQYNDVYIINSICSDLFNCLWVGTNNGLFRYSIDDNTLHRFDESDGLQGSVYHNLASLHGKENKMYFGGTNGFTVIDTRDIGFNHLKPRILISDFYINNTLAIPTWKDASKREIKLNYKQDNFGFKFSSDNYFQPDKNRFKYRLHGYDDRWLVVDAQNRTAMYSQIPSGTYYFEVLAANNDGVWGDPIVLKIRRTPAPWASWWAYSLYIIVALCVVLLMSYYYYRQRKLKLQLYIDNLDKQKKEELHQSQLRFFTNVSHDFRTPLSLILGALDNMKQEDIKEYYHSILHNNAQRLLNLVNELMDFRTFENGKMQLRIQTANVNQMIEEFSSDFRDYALKHNIKFTVLCDPKLPETLHIDKQILEKVVMNLLNNSFKYTEDGGEIQIITYSDISKFRSEYKYSYQVPETQISANNFVLVVSDTGIGISKDSIQNVFDRYYKVNTANLNQHLGTGIGLALVKSLMLLHKGTISIFSERGKGTDIAVYFSTNTSIYEDSEFTDISTVEPELSLSLPEGDVNNIMDDILPNGKKRILIVEDNNDLRKLLSNFLSLRYEIIEAANGVEASQILTETDVELILCDIMMPLKDGITLCCEVKADVNTSHIPFIMLTAKTGLDAQMEGVGSGADLYFEKPVDFNLLLLTLNNIFCRQKHLREYYAQNYYADSVELSANEQDNTFIKKVIEVIDANLSRADIDIGYISSELSMSQRKFYSKLKMLTGKSAVQFILNYKLKRAARMIIEQDMAIQQVMEQIGIKSFSYFTTAFRKEFGESPSSFATQHKKKKKNSDQSPS